MKKNFPSLLIILISVLLPLVVAFLYYMPKEANTGSGFDFRILPTVNAVLNTITTILLITAYLFIQNRKIQAHRVCMLIALAMSVLFLISYVIYHATTPSTTFGGEGFEKYFYYAILITHIIGAAAVVPMVLITLTRALREKFDKHRQIARITFPLWLYVTVTGVIVYILIAPYYPP